MLRSGFLTWFTRFCVAAISFLDECVYVSFGRVMDSLLICLVWRLCVIIHCYFLALWAVCRRGLAFIVADIAACPCANPSLPRLCRGRKPPWWWLRFKEPLESCS